MTQSLGRTLSLAVMAMGMLLITLTGCQKNLSFENAGPADSSSNGSGGSTPVVTLNTWTFTANNHVYSGKVSSAQFTTLIGGQLLVVGTLQSGSTDTVLALSVQFPGSTLDLGTYPSSDPGTNFALEKVPSGDIVFASNALSPQLLNITVSAYDKTAKTVEGSFSGDSYNFDGITVPITSGTFKAKLQ